MSVQTRNRFSSWRTILITAAGFWIILPVADSVLAYVFGPQLWSNASYFFGNNVKATLGIFMFIEGAVILAAGLVWASGSMETVFQGSNLNTNPYYRKDDWSQRREQTEKQNVSGKILMLIGTPILLSAAILLVAV
jgi:hypothetical protein